MSDNKFKMINVKNQTEEKKVFIKGICIIHHHHDYYSDLSDLKTEFDEDKQEIISSMQYTNEDIKTEGWEKVKSWIDEDNKRLQQFHSGEIHHIGITAETLIYIPKGYNAHLMQKITSGGLWGIESDSDESYFKEVEDDEIEDLCDTLDQLGISYKNIEVKPWQD